MRKYTFASGLGGAEERKSYKSPFVSGKGGKSWEKKPETETREERRMFFNMQQL